MRLKLPLILLACAGVALPADDAKNKAAAAATSADGHNMQSSFTDPSVTRNAYIHTLLIPPKVVRSMFGRAVADTHAVIQITISNRSHEQALILHGVFIDYSQWLLSGCGRNLKADIAELSSLDDHQVGTKPCQVSSAELRAVRQLAQEGQVD